MERKCDQSPLNQSVLVMNSKTSKSIPRKRQPMMLINSKYGRSNYQPVPKVLIFKI